MTKRPVPTYIVDEHNEAFYAWHKARHAGILDGPLDLLHIDAHDDMAEPGQLSRPLYWSAGDEGDYLSHHHALTYDDLSIANFIVPAVLDGTVRNVYFVFPGWRGYERKSRRLNVGSAFGEGSVVNGEIRASGDDPERVRIAYPDLTDYRYVVCPIESIPGRRRAIVDIDLDYFACNDAIDRGVGFELRITREEFERREIFARGNRRLKYLGLEVTFRQEDDEYVAVVRFTRRRDRSHLPTTSAIRREIDHTVETLVAKKVRPAVLTICRSRISGYCPPEVVPSIEQYLLERLETAYGSLAIEESTELA